MSTQKKPAPKRKRDSEEEAIFQAEQVDVCKTAKSEGSGLHQITVMYDSDAEEEILPAALVQLRTASLSRTGATSETAKSEQLELEQFAASLQDSIPPALEVAPSDDDSDSEDEDMDDDNFEVEQNPWIVAARDEQWNKLKSLAQNKTPGHEAVLNDFGDTIWLLAARKNQLVLLKLLAEHKIPGRDNLTKIKFNIWHVAAENGALVVLKWLIDNKDEIPGHDTLTPNGNKFVHLAVCKNDLNTLEWMVSNKVAGYDALSGEGGNLWHTAAFGNDVDALDCLKKNNMPGQDLLDFYGKNIWHYAVAAGNLNVLEWLVKHQVPGRDVLDSDGHNLYHQAVKHGKAKALDWLVEHQVLGQHALNKNGHNLWQLGSIYGYENVLDWLTLKGTPGRDVPDSKHDYWNLWHYASANNEVNILRWLTKKGVPNRDEFDIEHNNIWLNAAPFGCVDVLKYLFTSLYETNMHGYNITEHKIAAIGLFATNLRGNNIAHRAAANGHTNVLDWLLTETKMVSLISALNVNRENLWHIAARWNYTDVLKWLAKNSPENYSHTDINGNNPLHLAALNGQLSAFAYLSEDVKSKDLIVKRNKSGATVIDCFISYLHTHNDKAAEIIPVIQSILKKNPGIRIISSPDRIREAGLPIELFRSEHEAKLECILSPENRQKLIDAAQLDYSVRISFAPNLKIDNQKSQDSKHTLASQPRFFTNPSSSDKPKSLEHFFQEFETDVKALQPNKNLIPNCQSLLLSINCKAPRGSVKKKIDSDDNATNQLLQEVANICTELKKVLMVAAVDNNPLSTTSAKIEAAHAASRLRVNCMPSNSRPIGSYFTKIPKEALPSPVKMST